MRRGYVDSQGNPIDYNFESKKGMLICILIFEILVPLVILGFIIYTCSINKNCNDIYSVIKNSASRYLKDNDLFPSVDGETVNVLMGDLYESEFLKSSSTNNTRCDGRVIVTKTGKNYVYTPEIESCGKCSISSRYSNSYSSWLSYYPGGKSLVYVKPFYNYYGRQVNATSWSDWLDRDDLSNKTKYGVHLPKDMDMMPEVPKEGHIVSVNSEEKYMYRYQDKLWKWYDIEGDYSDFSSEKVSGYAFRDDYAMVYSAWSEYSQNYPEERSYREIQTVDGRKYYYVDKKGKKVYAGNGDYLAPDEVNTSKYDKYDDDSVKLYRYHDKMWRWYNGERRKYSSLSGYKPQGYNFRDDETESLGTYSTWSDTSSITPENKDYRVEERKTMVRYAYVYEFLTDPILNNPVDKSTFVKSVKMSVPEFSMDDNYKLSVTYKYRYRIKK